MLALLADATPGAEADGRLEQRRRPGRRGAGPASPKSGWPPSSPKTSSRDRGATGRLAEAFNALVTSDDQRRPALLLAEERVSLSPLGTDPQFNDIWTDTRRRC